MVGSLGAPASAVVKVGGPPLKLYMGISPKKLPRLDWSPVTIRVEGEVSRPLDGGLPPFLRGIAIAIDRDVSVAPRGFKVCKRGVLMKSSAGVAKQICRGALLGRGVALVGTEPALRLRRVPLAIFAGGLREDGATLLFHGDAWPRSSDPFVWTVRLKRSWNGRYGTLAIVDIPAELGQFGSLLGFEIEISVGHGTPAGHSRFAVARCMDGLFETRVLNFTFANGEQFSGERTTHPCIPMPLAASWRP